MLKKELQETFYNTYIRDLKPIEISDDTIVFEVPQKFLIDAIENKYYPLIRKAIIETTGKEFRLHFYTTGQYKPKETAAPKETKEKSGHVSNLSEKYTFDSFVVGESNRFAYSAAKAVAAKPGKSFNPLFIYGDSGLGKTHMLHAIGNEITSRSPNKKVLYVSAETFISEFISAIENRKTEAFKNKYRKIDVLLMDDIQFLSNKEALQNEFFYTFNSLYELGKQIVVTSDRPPKEVSILEERIKTRFQCGIIVDIQTPDFETKVAILNKKSSEKDIEISNDVLEYISRHTGGNVRELEGIINYILMFKEETDGSGKDVSSGKVTINLVKDALRHLESNTNEVTPKLIIDVISRYYNVSVDDLLSGKRNKEFAYPRQIAMYFCRVLTDYSFPEIAEFFNGKNHTTIMHGYNKICDTASVDKELRSQLEEIENTITGS